MTQLPQGLRYLTKIIVALIWGLLGFLFLDITVSYFLIPHLAIQSSEFATNSIAIVTNPGLMILGGMLIGMASLLLWLPSFNRFVSLALAILVPILLFVWFFVLAMSDPQNRKMQLAQAAQNGNLEDVREQLLIQNPILSQSKRLIQLGTNVNARDSQGHSALYTASWDGGDPEVMKLLLQSGAKPDALALRNAISRGRLEAIQLMFKATSDDGKALVAELGKDALQSNTVHTRTSEADRAEITKLLKARGAK